MRFIRIGLFIVISLVCTVRVFAVACDDVEFQRCKDSGDPNICRELSNTCQSKINENVGQQKTLSATISYLNNKIRLTELQVKQTEYEILDLEKQIGLLKTRIGGLEISLQRLTEVLISRIQLSYKQQSNNPFFLLFSSGGLSEFVTKYKYVQLGQKHTQGMIQEAESQKVLYDKEKLTKEEKQKQVMELKKKLQTQQSSLQSQQKQKQALLTATRSDEKQYQSLKSQAEAQIRAFVRYATSQGGASILSNQTKCDGWGCYYNQRDSKWATQSIGLSGVSMANAGCLVTSMAMVASHYGKSLTPGDIASSPTVFSGALMVLGNWTVDGVTMTRSRDASSSRISTLDRELEAGRPVVVGLFAAIPEHFIVIRAKEGSNYIMYDPFLENGGNRPFSDKYSLNDIKVVDVVRVY